MKWIIVSEIQTSLVAPEMRFLHVVRHRRRTATKRHQSSLLRVYFSPRQTTTTQPQSVSDL